HLMVCRIPAPRPVLVGPAEAEGQRAGGVGQLGIQWLFQQAFPGKPVIVIAEAADAMCCSECLLLASYSVDAQVVEAEVGRQVRLVVAGEQRLRLAGIAPFGKTLAPPLVVFRDGVELWQVEGDQPCHVGHQKCFWKSTPQRRGRALNTKPPVEYSALYSSSKAFFAHAVTDQSSGSSMPMRKSTRWTSSRSLVPACSRSKKEVLPMIWYSVRAKNSRPLPKLVMGRE